MEGNETQCGIYVSVGSNVLAETHILKAAIALSGHVQISAVSPLYETPPKGPRDQPRFVNGVWRVDTDVGPRSLKFDVLRRVEAKLGRVRTEDKFAPRPIDLDLILYDGVISDTPDLVLPDPDIRRYSHIAVPLADVAPNLVLPGCDTPIKKLARTRDRRELVSLPLLTQQLKGILYNG
jgi:2-amino-4-hydroxy-6-hydroxymethyldihydropteridine diphosphokinase